MNVTKTCHFVITDVLEPYELETIRYWGTHFILRCREGSRIGQKPNYQVNKVRLISMYLY